MDNMLQNTDVRPTHYRETSLECRDVMRIMFGDVEYMYFCMMNAFKYLWRHSQKGEKTDLEKAMWYINEAGDIAVKAGITPPVELEGMNTILNKEMDKYAEHEK